MDSTLGKATLAEAARKAFSSGLVTSLPGVLGLRLSPEAMTVFFTPADLSFEDVQPHQICVVHLTGTSLEVPDQLELPTHLKLYLKIFQDRQDVVAFAHLHPPKASSYAAQGLLFDLLGNVDQRPVKELLKVECSQCPSRFTGLCSCRSDIRKSYAGADALLLRGDGIITLAENLNSALSMALFIERSAQYAFENKLFEKISAATD